MTAESWFENTYVYKTFLAKDMVKAELSNGTVTLSGTVADEFQMLLAVDTAANMPGVFRIDNKLTTKAEVAAEYDDTWIGRKISLNLLLHRHVNAFKTHVEVKNGIVTLTGKASSLAQKDLTTEYAKDIKGVNAVKNEMMVLTQPEQEVRTATEKMDDASVTAQIKLALFTHMSTSSVKTKIETRDGVVTLTGIAANAAEKSLITKLVTDIQGVTSLKNQMTIAEAKSK